MSTKHIAAVIAAVALSAGAVYAQDPSTAPAQPPTVNQRLENQKDRVQAGVADDQLTKREAARAAAHDQAIHAQEKQDRQANGGNLTNNEKTQLNRELNRNSREIARARHNNRTPKS